LFDGGSAKTDRGGDNRVMMGHWLVWGQNLDPNVYQNTIGKLSLKAFDWCNKNAVVPVCNHTRMFFKDTKQCWFRQIFGSAQTRH
jgi:hypothetical protein